MLPGGFTIPNVTSDQITADLQRDVRSVDHAGLDTVLTGGPPSPPIRRPPTSLARRRSHATGRGGPSNPAPSPVADQPPAVVSDQRTGATLAGSSSRLRHGRRRPLRRTTASGARDSTLSLRCACGRSVCCQTTGVAVDLTLGEAPVAGDDQSATPAGTRRARRRSTDGS